MAFDKEKIKDNYSTDEDNVLKEFYIPVLKESVSYDRAVGYFSSQGLLKFLQGIDGLLKNNGKMRLVIGDTLSDDEYASIKNSDDYQDAYKRLDEKWSEIFSSSESELSKHRLHIFSWLLNRGFLEIKYAFRRKGLFHKKIGIVKDKDGSIVSFSGSMNETESAMTSNRDNPDGNSEEFSVYPSWKEEAFESYGQSKIDSFNKVWNCRETNTITIDLPSSHYERIKGVYTNSTAPKSNIEKNQAELFDQIINDDDNEKFDFIKPRLPKRIGGNKYKIREHQIDALKKWQKNNYHGIMALATGAGKTITAIHGAVKISEKNRIVLVVSVPYQVLAEQWCSVLEMFNIKAIKCYESRVKWQPTLVREIQNFLLEIGDFLAIVVVNATLAREEFTSLVGEIPSKSLFFVGDECHHHGGNNIARKLPDAKYRLGLSATPWSESEEDSRIILESFYGPIVASYTLKEALQDDVLTGYKYFIYPVSLNSEEEEDYEKLSQQISSLYNKEDRSNTEDSILSNLIFKRARLLDALEDKFLSLENLLSSKDITQHTLFYCGSGSSMFSESVEDGDNEKIRSIDRITKILYRNNWNISKFTAEESHKDRVRILENFTTKNIDAIAAIKVLDEGFDVPMCKEAYITASSRNERQFIQRRGRILRKSPGKKEAIIHDFVILPNRRDHVYKKLVENELNRVKEFYSVANNKIDIYDSIVKILNDYNIDIDFMEGD
jgi:superfamily II DNA or RNA helicase